MKPLARSEDLVVRDLRGEVVVYDTRSHRAHCLNSTAAFVFRHADGRRTAGEIAALLGPGADEDLVQSALDQLTEAGLLAPISASVASAPSRREVVRRIGLGVAVLAPTVASLLVPTPAEAAGTCIPANACNGTNNGQSCYVNNKDTECSLYTCQSGSCVP